MLEHMVEQYLIHRWPPNKAYTGRLTLPPTESITHDESAKITSSPYQCPGSVLRGRTGRLRRGIAGNQGQGKICQKERCEAATLRCVCRPCDLFRGRDQADCKRKLSWRGYQVLQSIQHPTKLLQEICILYFGAEKTWVPKYLQVVAK